MFWVSDVKRYFSEKRNVTPVARQRVLGEKGKLNRRGTLSQDSASHACEKVCFKSPSRRVRYKSVAWPEQYGRQHLASEGDWLRSYTQPWMRKPRKSARSIRDYVLRYMSCLSRGSFESQAGGHCRKLARLQLFVQGITTL